MVNWISYSEACAQLRKPEIVEGRPQTTLKIALGGNANVDFLIPGIRSQLLDDGFHSEIVTLPFNNWVSETFKQEIQFDAWVIWLSSLGLTRGLTERSIFDTSDWINALNRLAENGRTVILVLPEPTVIEDDPFSPSGKWRAQLVAEMQRNLHESVITLSVDHLVFRVGMDKWAAPRYWEQAKCPCHPDSATFVGIDIAVTLSRLFKPIIKAIVVDLDDTLWGGLVGEVGANGLNINPDGSGSAYLSLQRFLLDQKSNGVALAVASKNDLDIAKSPFLERSEMLLKIDDFLRFEASWEPKYLAIERLASQLNIGIDSICFLDDSDAERHQAKQMLSNLIVPDLPASPNKRVEYLVRSRLFTRPRVHKEDLLRLEYFARPTLPESGNLDGYLESLKMKIQPNKICSTNFDRTLSLLHKTNQFNLSLWRPSHSELQSFTENLDNYSYCFTLRDKLGDAGLTSVFLAEAKDSEATIRAWVISCRVFSRGFEWAIAKHFKQWAIANRIQFVKVDYVEGPRNGMLGQILQELGFTQSSESQNYKAMPTVEVNIPNHFITLEE